LIAQLTGTVAWTAGAYIVLDVGGVGYKVSVPVTVLEALPPAGEKLTLFIHTLVREDDISLFGFAGPEELRVFELLLSVSGVGPKAALALLSALPAEDLAQAVAGEDVRTLTRVPGVGAKTAQRLVLELRDKLSLLALERTAAGKPAPGAKKRDARAEIVEDVVSALLNLGYNKPESARATEAARDEMVKAGAPEPEFAPLLRAALNRLTGKGKG
jgi:Holliday junction DNA helicase RuvA